MRIHEKAVAKAEAEAADGESETKVKASLKDADMFGYVKATKEFVAGMRVLTQYFEEYSKNYPGLNVEIDPMLFFSILAKDGTKTLKNLFDEAVAQAQAKAV